MNYNIISLTTLNPDGSLTRFENGALGQVLVGVSANQLPQWKSLADANIAAADHNHSSVYVPLTGNSTISGTITATRFVGDLTGTATEATHASSADTAITAESATTAGSATIADTANQVANALSITLGSSGTATDYDGSQAVSITITPGSIGAAETNHTHPYLPLAGGAMDSASVLSSWITENAGFYAGLVHESVRNSQTFLLKTKIGITGTSLGDYCIRIHGYSADNSSDTVDYLIYLSNTTSGSAGQFMQTVRGWRNHGSLTPSTFRAYAQDANNKNTWNNQQQSCLSIYFAFSSAKKLVLSVDFVSHDLTRSDIVDSTATEYQVINGWGFVETSPSGSYVDLLSTSPTAYLITEIAQEAAKVSHALTITHINADYTTTTLTYDGSVARSVTEQAYKKGILYCGADGNMMAYSVAPASGSSNVFLQWTGTAYEFVALPSISALTAGTTAADKILVSITGNAATWKTLSEAGIAPTSHASTTTTYGASSATSYGHAKATTTTPKADTESGSLGTEVDSFARGDHAHPTPVVVEFAKKFATPRGIGLTGGVTAEVTEYVGDSDAIIRVTAIDPDFLSAPVPIAKGGTGATTAAAALTNLGAAASSHNHSISNITSGITKGGLVVGSSTTALTFISPVAAGSILGSNGTSASPTWKTPAQLGLSTRIKDVIEIHDADITGSYVPVSVTAGHDTEVFVISGQGVASSSYEPQLQFQAPDVSAAGDKIEINFISLANAGVTSVLMVNFADGTRTIFYKNGAITTVQQHGNGLTISKGEKLILNAVHYPTTSDDLFWMVSKIPFSNI